MSEQISKTFSKKWTMMSASMAVLGAVAFMPAQSYAQETPVETTTTTDDDIDEIVATGIRQQLKTAQQLKRNAGTVIDSITADDMGGFPDKSVAEALQRVAGITVERFAAKSDTAHFSAEPSGVVVRGLQQVRNEFNGRDSFSADSSRGLGWSDVSPELMGGVDVYKNQMAELIEGGIAGTVNLRTRLPFDSAERHIVLSASANYGDLSKKITPDFSGIFSDRWESSIGEFGLMANFAYSKVQTQTEGVRYGRMVGFLGYLPDPTAETYFPADFGIREVTYDRERKGYALAGQWRNNEDTLLATVQLNSSDYQQDFREHVVKSLTADLIYGQGVDYRYDINANGDAPRPAPGTDPFVWGSDGLFQTGTLVSPIGWWGNNDAESALVGANAAGQPLVNACYGWNGCSPDVRGGNMETQTRYATQRRKTKDLSFNLKWTPTDRLKANFDVQHVDSTVSNYDIEIGMDTWANNVVDLTGDVPQIEFTPGTNINYSPGGFSNANNYYYHHIMDHVEDSEGKELALRADVAYEIDGGWLDTLKVGVRHAKREQDVRWSTYNWANVANTWTQNAAYFNVDAGPDAATGFTGYSPDAYTTFAFDTDFYGGGALVGNQEFVFANFDLVEDREGYAALMGRNGLNLPTGAGWDPLCSNSGVRADEIAGTCFKPLELLDLTETTNAAYAQMDFGGDEAKLFGFPVTGNLGVRYVQTKVESGGNVVQALLEPFSGAAFDPANPRPRETNECYTTTTPPPPAPANSVVPQSIGCFLSQADFDFNDGSGAYNLATTTHNNWLPSFNIKFDLTDEWLFRVAASRAMSRPDLGLLKNYTNISVGYPSSNTPDDPRWVTDGNGNYTGVTPTYRASTYNPALKPITADQIDLSLEHYFADVGSFSAAFFYKKFNNYIEQGRFFRDFTHNGITQQVEVTGPYNGDGASIKGVEFSYQRFFDFLPDPFNGFGMQANYTYVDNQGIQNQGLTSVSGNGESTDESVGAPGKIQVNALEGLSNHSFNLIGMYEKDKLSARLAYSWRSKYLITIVDCCVLLPIWNSSQGQLDGSVRYDINDNFQLSFQASNLLGAETTLEQQLTDDVGDTRGQLLPNAYFKNDRRFTAGILVKF